MSNPRFKHRYLLKTYLYLVIAIGSLFSCKSDNALLAALKQSKEVTQANNQLDQINLLYDVENFEKIVLPKRLIEISGLTIDASSEEIFAINDEKAIIFKINKEGEILSQLDFGKNGDYEGIEKVDNSIFALKSNGKIFEFDLTAAKDAIEYNNPLSLSNDTEGLGYDQSTHSLLIACKGSPNIKHNPKLKKTKAIYAFDVNTKRLVDQPFITIDDEQIELFIKQITKHDISKKKFKQKLNRAKKFSPSAIAQNPIDGYYYLLSTQGKILLVSDRKSSIKAIYFLDNAAYKQPEGICFDKHGNMWISNEGKGFRGNLLKVAKLN